MQSKLYQTPWDLLLSRQTVCHTNIGMLSILDWKGTLFELMVGVVLRKLFSKKVYCIGYFVSLRECNKTLLLLKLGKEGTEPKVLVMQFWILVANGDSIVY